MSSINFIKGANAGKVPSLYIWIWLYQFLFHKGPSDLQPSLLHVENSPRDASDSIIPENSIYPKKIRRECVRSLPWDSVEKHGVGRQLVPPYPEENGKLPLYLYLRYRRSPGRERSLGEMNLLSILNTCDCWIAPLISAKNFPIK